MNSAPNSDSKQSPKSKLSWVHRVHTQWTLAVRTLRPGRPCRGRVVAHVAACARPYRGPPFVVSRASPVVSWRMPGRVATLYRDTLRSQAMRVRTAALSVRRPAMLQHCSAVLQASPRPYRGPCCAPMRAVSRNNSIVS